MHIMAAKLLLKEVDGINDITPALDFSGIGYSVHQEVSHISSLVYKKMMAVECLKCQS